jgi:hypothetical protein
MSLMNLKKVVGNFVYCLTAYLVFCNCKHTETYEKFHITNIMASADNYRSQTDI